MRGGRQTRRGLTASSFSPTSLAQTVRCSRTSGRSVLGSPSLSSIQPGGQGSPSFALLRMRLAGRHCRGCRIEQKRRPVRSGCPQRTRGWYRASPPCEGRRHLHRKSAGTWPSPPSRSISAETDVSLMMRGHATMFARPGAGAAAHNRRASKCRGGRHRADPPRRECRQSLPRSLRLRACAGQNKIALSALDAFRRVPA